MKETITVEMYVEEISSLVFKRFEHLDYNSLVAAEILIEELNRFGFVTSDGHSVLCDLTKILNEEMKARDDRQSIEFSGKNNHPTASN